MQSNQTFYPSVHDLRGPVGSVRDIAPATETKRNPTGRIELPAPLYRRAAAPRLRRNIGRGHEGIYDDPGERKLRHSPYRNIIPRLRDLSSRKSKILQCFFRTEVFVHCIQRDRVPHECQWNSTQFYSDVYPNLPKATI